MLAGFHGTSKLSILTLRSKDDAISDISVFTAAPFQIPFSCSRLSFLSTSLPFFSFVGSSTPLSLSPMCPSTFLYQIKHLWTLASTQQPALYKAWPSPEVCPSALPSDLLTNQNFHFLDINILFFFSSHFCTCPYPASAFCPISTTFSCVSQHHHIVCLCIMSVCVGACLLVCMCVRVCMCVCGESEYVRGCGNLKLRLKVQLK